jgi:Flp pilus assembly protein protease CpaA
MLTDPRTVNTLIRLGASIALLALAGYDLRHKRVPNCIVQPLLIASAVVLALRLGLNAAGWGDLALVGMTWATCAVLWWLRVFGGGDMKLVMALAALFPDIQLIYLLLGAALIGLLLVLVIGDRRAGLQRLAAIIVMAGHGVLPQRAEISAAYRSRGQPITFALSLGAVLYLWLFWAR